MEASEVGGGHDRTVIYGRDTQDTGGGISFVERVEPADKPESMTTFEIIISVLAYIGVGVALTQGREYENRRVEMAATLVWPVAVIAVIIWGKDAKK